MTIIDSRVLNIEELKLEHFKKGEQFESSSARIGALLGAKDLGYSYDVVPAGKRSCPFHSHRGEEEMAFTATPGQRHAALRRWSPRKIRCGRCDLLSNRRPGNGAPDHHRLRRRTGNFTCGVSTMTPAEVCEYRDSRKVGAFGGGLRHKTRAGDGVDATGRANPKAAEEDALSAPDSSQHLVDLYMSHGHTEWLAWFQRFTFRIPAFRSTYRSATRCCRRSGPERCGPVSRCPPCGKSAAALKVDLNTVRHALPDLEQTGAIVILRARGTYVAERPPPVDETRQAKRAASLAQQAIAMSNAAGVDPCDVAQEILHISKRQRSSK